MTESHIRALCPLLTALGAPVPQISSSLKLYGQFLQLTYRLILKDYHLAKGSRAVPKKTGRQEQGHGTGRVEVVARRGQDYLSWSLRPCQAVRVWVVYSSIQSL